MTKTPEYTRKAIDKYNKKYDRITVNFPKGTKKKIKELTGDTAGGFAVKCVINELQRLEDQEKTTE
jgi:hypothetical protein